MRWFAFFCILMWISLFQSTLINWINIGQAVPDLYFPLMIFYSFLADVRRNTISNWFVGMSKDLFSEGSFGINSVFFVAVGFFVWSIRGILFRGHIITQVLVTFFFSCLYNILYALHTTLSFHTLSLSSTIWTIFICSFYTAMITPVFFWLLGKLQPTQSFFSQ